MTPSFQSIPLSRSLPFSHDDWIFEIKWDGFRSLAHVDSAKCRLMSRNGNEFKSFSGLNHALKTLLRSRSAVLDGEIVCLDSSGKSQFRDLLFRRGDPRFIAFDLLWIDGEDLRYASLVDRKRRLRALLPQCSDVLLYCDHVEKYGEGLFQLIRENDLEGVVAKPKSSPYLPDHANWLKIRNQGYSQWAGREKFFERERNEPLDHWDQCTLACAEVGRED